MLIARATRHDKGDLEAFYAAHEWTDPHLEQGVSFIARQGGIVAGLTVIDVAPQTVIIEDVLVDENQRGRGLGTQLLQAAMNSRGGTMVLCCHDERIAFYGRLGFEEVPFDQLPEAAQRFMRDDHAYPFTPDHVHHFMKAR
ncbi:MAG: GNAT family N-acetyltransferase [Actinomycetota bacterium]|nr:GNAT family N-acetyltransferase [Actinomycetota bacterium]